MTSHVLIKNGAVAEYPYSLSQLRTDNPDTSFSSDPPTDVLATWGVFKVEPSAKPDPTITQSPAEDVPVLSNGVWTQAWKMVNVSVEEAARRTEAAAQNGEFDAAKLDAWVNQFLAMTPTGAQDFVNANGATLAALRTNVARLAYVVRVLVRREFNR